MKTIRTISTWCIVLLAGCASVETEPPYPVRPTAYTRWTYVIDARWLPTLRGEQIVFTRDDRRTIASATGFTGAIRGEMVREAAQMQIARVDKDLAWYVDNRRRTYQECSLIGCMQADFLKALFNPQSRETQEPSASDERFCELFPVENRFKVSATGRKRHVCDYPAEEYKAVWRMVMRDKAGRKNTSTMTFTIGTTPLTPELERIQRTNENFQRGLLARHKEHDTILGQLLPAELYLQLAAFDGDISKKSIPATNQFSREMKKIKGMTVSFGVLWTADNKACPQTQTGAQAAAAEPEPSLDFSSGSAFLAAACASAPSIGRARLSEASWRKKSWPRPAPPCSTPLTKSCGSASTIFPTASSSCRAVTNCNKTILSAAATGAAETEQGPIIGEVWS